jgi:hypothetical protein
MEFNNSIEQNPAALSETCANLPVFRTGIPSGTKSLLTEFFKNFLNARRIVVADSGHLMYLEKPQEFTRIVIGFLQAIVFRRCYEPIHDFRLRALKNRRFFPLVVVGFFVSLHSPVVRLPCRKGKLNE